MTYNESTDVCTLSSVPRLDNFIERFTKERQYLKGVTPPTLAWYKYILRAFLRRAYDERLIKESLKLSWLQEEQKVRLHEIESQA